MTSFIQFYLPLIMNVAKYFLFAGIPFLICYRLFPHVFSKSKIQSSIAVNKDFLREIRHSLLTTVILAAVVILILKLHCATTPDSTRTYQPTARGGFLLVCYSPWCCMTRISIGCIESFILLRCIGGFIWSITNLSTHRLGPLFRFTF